MKQYRITAKLLAPLVIRQNRQSNTSPSTPYLPGTSLRGALAEQYILLGGCPNDDTFRLLFIEQPVRFPNLLPTDGGNSITQVLPLTSVSCKRDRGFKGDDKHGASDILVQKLAERNHLKTRGELTCPDCGNDMKPLSGFWNGNTEFPSIFQTITLFQRHTGIDRITGTITPSIFFITQAMADFYKTSDSGKYLQQLLSGSMYLDDKQYGILSAILKDPIFTGAHRSRGHGEIELFLEPMEISSSNPDIIEWDKKFKAKLERTVEGDMPSNLLSGHYFSIMLESDAILVDAFLRPSSELALSFDGIESVLKVARSQVIRGWQAAWGLPKPDDVGLCMGSVFLFKYIGNNMDGLEKFLSQTALNGIGLRREEGFGRISICDPIHTIEGVI